MPISSPTAVLIAALGLSACGGTSTPSALAPSPPVVPAAPAPIQPQELVRGLITDTAWRYISGVQVEVLDGPQMGTTTLTDAAGAFAFPGVFDDASRFRASKGGYVEAIGTSRPPACATCARSIYFSLEPQSPPVIDLAGQYDLTFIAAESCTGLPEELRSRTYVASVARDESSRWRYLVSVSGASVLHGYSWEGITVGTTVDHATITLGNGHGDPGLLEQVDGNGYLSFDGSASMAVDSTPPTSLSGAFDGFIDHCVLPPGSASPVTTGRYICGTGSASVSGTRRSCFAANHRLILTRR
jgi:hypothetical protein